MRQWVTVASLIGALVATAVLATRAAAPPDFASVQVQPYTPPPGGGRGPVGPRAPVRGTARPFAGSSRRCSTPPPPPKPRRAPVCEFPNADASLILYECCTPLAGGLPSPAGHDGGDGTRPGADENGHGPNIRC